MICMKWRNGKFISIHAPRVGSDTSPCCGYADVLYFNPRSPCGERRCKPAAYGVCCQISIHAPRVGSDVFRKIGQTGHLHFNPRSPCGERLTTGRKGKFKRLISIHAPRVGSDDFAKWFSDAGSISIHAPRVGSDCDEVLPGDTVSIFQSTLPVWGATRLLTGLEESTESFNPRSPCGERRYSQAPN